MNNIGTIKLETKRLLLRRFEIEDTDDMFNNWANDKEVTKYLTWKTHQNIETTKEVLNNYIKNYNNKNFYQWAIVIKDNNELSGSIGISKVDENIESICFSYCLSKKYWGSGIITEALSKLIKLFFETVKVNRIEAFHSINNPNSGKVLIKSGFKKEAVLRDFFKDSTGINDAVMYSIIKKDYFNN